MYVPREEHPKPQMMRTNWENLNGLWDFAFDFSDSGVDKEYYKRDDIYTHKIVVPFCPESKLSGVNFTDFIPAVWYKRIVYIQEEKLKNRIILHFGAVDYACKIWVNGQEVGKHKGGYTSFSFDITSYVHSGDNTVVLYASDNPRSGKQSCGKQSASYASHGCFYTRTTGIWQTVWLEFVPQAYVSKMKLLPDAFNNSIAVTTELESAAGAILTLFVQDNGKTVTQKTIRVTDHIAHCSLKIENAHLWSPEDPHLYDLIITLEKNGETDRIFSYFGLRTVEWHDHKFWLNGKPLFQRLILDQGYYPDGIYTAPSDTALRKDIELSKALGFNGARLHQKVFEERLLYHADRLGYLVWGEYGSWGIDISGADGLEIFLPEWMESVERDYNHPALIGWCPFNETFDMPKDMPRHTQDDEVLRIVYQITKMVDPSRPVIDTSGFYHVETDIWDIHDYEQDSLVFTDRYGSLEPGDPCYNGIGKRHHYDGSQPLFMSEYGGTFWMSDEEKRKNMVNQQDIEWRQWENPKTEEDVINRIVELTTVLLKSKAFSGLCYVQLTDVEQEENGLYTYDRQKKFSDEGYTKIKAAILQTAAIEE